MCSTVLRLFLDILELPYRERGTLSIFETFNCSYVSRSWHEKRLSRGREKGAPPPPHVHTEVGEILEGKSGVIRILLA
jgi:hypothetical protein